MGTGNPRASLFVSLFSLALLSCAGAEGDLVVWTAPSLERIAADAPPGNEPDVHIHAARGETESFQLAIRSSRNTELTLLFTSLTHESGASIGNGSITAYREQYVRVTKSSPDWKGSNRPLPPGWYVDPLNELRPKPHVDSKRSGRSEAVAVPVGAGMNQPVWVDVAVPRDVPAGEYSGTYAVSDGTNTSEGAIKLTVWNFALPTRPALKSSFLIWQADADAASEELLRHRLMPAVSDPKDQRRLIDQYGLSVVNVGEWGGADYGNCRMSAPPALNRLKEKVAAQQKDLVLYNYTADEIGDCRSLFPTIKQWGARLHQAGVNNLVTMAPVQELMDDGTGSGRSAVDIWVVLPILYDKHAEQVAVALKKGDAVWSYNTLVQDAYSPKWLIDFAPVNFRIQPGLLNQSLGLSGLLYWRVDAWASDPWTDVYPKGFAEFPGEGMLLYPLSKNGKSGVAPSIRLKWLRDGVDDFDYVEMLKSCGEGDWALQQVRSVAPNWSDWTQDAAAVEAVRKSLGERLHSIYSEKPGESPACVPAGQRP